MKKPIKQSITVEQLYPNAKARRAADAAIDKLDPKLSMREFLDAWDQAYVDAGGQSPFRPT